MERRAHQNKYCKKHREANRKKILEKERKYREANREKLREGYKKYYKRHRGEILLYQKRHRETHKQERQEYLDRTKQRRREKRQQHSRLNKERLNANVRRWKALNKDKIRKYAKHYFPEYQRKRGSVDLAFRLRGILRHRVWSALKNNTKSAKTMELIGCSIEYLMGYLEAKFVPGMSWQNYGSWHVDHIKPCATFDLSKPEEQRKCFHYTNLQPLWEGENLTKGGKYAA
jgi:hypothetical protein